jgi:predicted TIM-barrel fold metal-dependent hydrolase
MSLNGAAAGWDCHVHVFDPAAPRLAGHYDPAAAPLEEIESLGREHGIGHLVLVQPSVYGTDNGVMLAALRAARGRHRGVGVMDDSCTPGALHSMHEVGVRGVRFNLVSPVGNGFEALERLAQVLRELGWHAQWYATAAQLPLLAELHERSAVPFVLDHLAGITPATADRGWPALTRLAERGAWVKLSGWYRLGCDAPYSPLVPLIARVADLFGERLIWGSDWPHTSLPRTTASRHASLLAPVRAALGDAALARILDDNPARLYDARGRL